MNQPIDDPGGGQHEGVKEVGQNLSYADRLKTNIKYDQRLKRNILEIVIEKIDKTAEIVLQPETVARIFRSIGLDIDTQVEGYQIQYGRVCIIQVWVEKSVHLDRFCKVENIVVSKGVMTGNIRPAGRKDVLVTVAGLDFNTPDTLVQEYITKFGAKIVNTAVIYSKFTEGPFKGKYNGERKYQVEFSEGSQAMGTYHYLDNSRIKIFYRGNGKTCGRCHQSSNSCLGGGVAKECEEQGGNRISLFDHMRQLWAKINFNPTSFKLPEDNDITGQEGGDKPISEIRAPAVEKAPLSEAIRDKLTGLKINNFPLEMSEEEIFNFLKANVSDEILKENVEMNKSERNYSIVITDGLSSDKILTAVENLDFKESKKLVLKKPLYCRVIRSITPVKPFIDLEHKSSSEKEDPNLEMSTSNSTPSSPGHKSNTGTINKTIPGLSLETESKSASKKRKKKQQKLKKNEEMEKNSKVEKNLNAFETLIRRYSLGSSPTLKYKRGSTQLSSPNSPDLVEKDPKMRKESSQISHE